MAKRSRRPVTPRPNPAPAPDASSQPATPDESTSPASGAAPISSATPTSSPTSSSSTSATPATSRPRNTSTKRQANRPRRTVSAEPTFFEKYRALIIGGAAVIGVLVVGYFLFFANRGPTGDFVASGPKYVCDSLLTPGPVETLPTPAPSFAATPTPATPSPAPTAAPSAAAGGSPSASGAPSDSAAPAASPAPSAAPTDSPSASGSPAASGTPTPEPTIRLGFTTEILGRNHVLDPNKTIEYGFCPPTSGDHYNIPGVGPIKAAVYPTNQPQPPGGWVHNLEHGWVVVLYRCTGPADCPTDAEMAQMTDFFNNAPTPDPAQGCPAPNKEVLVARFDSMDTRFAYLAWGRAYLTDTFDTNTALTFAQQWMDAGTEPEKTIC